MLYAFDCDGVLVDSEILASKVDAEHLTEVGYPITPEEVSRRFAGLTSREIMEIVGTELGRPLPESFFEETRVEIDRRLAQSLKAVAGVHELLDRLKEPRCICSNSSGERLKLSLEKTELYDRFEPYVYSAVEVGDRRPKPAPNVYLHAAEQFSVDPREMLVLEDSIFGVTAAVAAGARVVGFTGGSHAWPGLGDLLIEAGAETVIRRLADLPKVAAALMVWNGIAG
jgi:HAD superfamily hydrolase (TIGR01509 family)